MSVVDRFAETLAKVPETCLETNENGHHCVRRAGHDGEHKAAGPSVRGIEVWIGNGPVANREVGESTFQQTLFAATDGGNDHSRDTGMDQEVDSDG